MPRGFFITFEGVDGCGKTTQLRLLAERLRQAGHPVRETREPGGTPLGLSIREILLNIRAVHSADSVPTPLTEALLYAADRAQHVDTVIRPALDRGELVLCDRFTDSTRAYQGYARGNDLDLIDSLVRIASGGVMPDLTLLFDLPVEAGQARLRDRHTGPDRLDAEKNEFHERVRQAYLTLAAAEPKRFRVLDARHSIEAVQEAVWDVVRARIPGGA